MCCLGRLSAAVFRVAREASEVRKERCSWASEWFPGRCTLELRPRWHAQGLLPLPKRGIASISGLARRAVDNSRVLNLAELGNHDLHPGPPGGRRRASRGGPAPEWGGFKISVNNWEMVLVLMFQIVKQDRFGWLYAGGVYMSSSLVYSKADLQNRPFQWKTNTVVCKPNQTAASWNDAPVVLVMGMLHFTRAILEIPDIITAGFEMCFAPQRRAIFHLSSGQMAPHPPL